MSAPIHEVDFNSPAEWKNSCRLDQDASRHLADLDLESYHDVDNASNKDALDRIVIVVKNALAEVDERNPNAGDENWTHKYARHYFRKDLKTCYNEMKNVFDSNFLSWLPLSQQPHKTMGQPLAQEYYKDLDRNTTLRETYEGLQKMAVALEQVLFDQHRKHEPFEARFSDAFIYLIQSVLCEVDSAIAYFQVSKPTDIERNIMQSHERKYETETHRNIRDMIILIHYINFLEYLQNVFEYLRDKS